MCRFTYAIDQQNVGVPCFSLNVSKRGSLRLVGKRQKILRVLPTIVETQEDGREIHSEEQDDCKIEIPSAPLCGMIQSSALERENQTAKAKNAVKINGAKANDVYDFRKINYSTKKILEPINPRRINNPRQTITEEIQKQEQNVTRFQGFGDFFPKDFVKDFDANVPAEVGIKNYLEKKRAQCKKLNCREEEMRELNKSRGAEVQSWLHFFG